MLTNRKGKKIKAKFKPPFLTQKIYKQSLKIIEKSLNLKINVSQNKIHFSTQFSSLDQEFNALYFMSFNFKIITRIKGSFILNRT